MQCAYLFYTGVRQVLLPPPFLEVSLNPLFCSHLAELMTRALDGEQIKISQLREACADDHTPPVLGIKRHFITVSQLAE